MILALPPGKRSPLLVLRENEVTRLHDRMARVAAVLWKSGASPANGLNVSDAASCLSVAYPHPFVSGNRLESFTMNATSMNFPGHDRSIGQRGGTRFIPFDLAIIAPSGTDGPFAGMPALNEQIITRFPTIDLMHPRLGDEPQPPASAVTDEPITFHVS